MGKNISKPQGGFFFDSRCMCLTKYNVNLLQVYYLVTGVKLKNVRWLNQTEYNVHISFYQYHTVHV